jgi:NADH-quinone oxidoreductase subunit G
MEHGAKHGRYSEVKRAVVDHDLGPFVSTCMTRCIHCTRCVRFADEVAGTGDMGVLNRSDHMRIEGIVEEALESELSGNLADICPVGALLDKPSHDITRPWEVTRHKSTCTQCPQGCDIVIESRGDEVIRIKPDVDGVEPWICDRGRYVHDAFRSDQRILTPVVREKSGFVNVPWDEAIQASVDLLKDKRVGIIFSPDWSLEGLAAIRLLHDSVFKDAKVAFDLHRRDMRDFAFEEGFSMSTSQITAADQVVILGSDLRQRLPILMQALRKRSNEGKPVIRIGAMNYRTNSEISADALIRPREWVAVIARAMQQLKDLGKTAAGMDAWLEKVEVRHEAGKLLADALLADSCALLVGEEIRSHSDAAALIHGLDLMMRAAGHAEAEADGRNLIPEGMNAQLLSAAFGDIRVSAGDLLDAASDGELDALILIGSDPMGDGLFSMQAKRAMGKVPLVQIGAIAGQTSEFANVMLPAAAYSEVEGTFINMEGRIRLAEHPLRSLGEERPLWKVMMRLVQAFGEEVPVVNLAELRTRVEAMLPEISAVWDDGVSDDWCLPVVRNREANSVPNAIEPVMQLDVVSRYSMYREGMWVRASSFLVEAGDIHALDDLLVHPNTLKDAGLNVGACKVRTASGDYDYHVGVREDVAEGVLFISKRGVAGDLSCEVMASLEGGQ